MQSYRLRGVDVPAMFYGTAWKEERTTELARMAIDAGFVAIDTANQRKHYDEAGVGAAIGDRRDALFLQTKFTYARGQDHRLPYDPEAPFATQVRQSFASSLEHLQTDRIDALVLHGPWSGSGIARADREVWAAMEGLVAAGQVRLLGVSNIALEQLVELERVATIKPALVQNRCYARTGWDREVRAFCRDHDMRYQGFSLLTANARELMQPAITRVVGRTGRSAAEVVFAFASAVGMIALTGTSSPAHMRLDLAATTLALEPDEVRDIDQISR